MMRLVSSLDMQIPTLLLGDFNGSADPKRDFHRGVGRLISPLLTSLLHPLGPFLDLQLEISPELWGYTYLSSRACGAALPRIDLILGNRAAVGLVERVHVASGGLDVEHLPLLVDLRPLPLAIPWTASCPRLPPLLQQAPSELRKTGRSLSSSGRIRRPTARSSPSPPHPQPRRSPPPSQQPWRHLWTWPGGGNSAPLHPAQHMSPQRFDGSAGPCDFWERHVPW